MAIAIRIAVVEKGLCRIQAGAGHRHGLGRREGVRRGRVEGRSALFAGRRDSARVVSPAGRHHDLRRRQLRLLHLEPGASSGEARPRRQGRAQRPVRSGRGRLAGAPRRGDLAGPRPPGAGGPDHRDDRRSERRGSRCSASAWPPGDRAPSTAECVEHAPEPRHGQTSRVLHEGSALFDGIPESVRSGRYHRLVVREDRAAAELVVDGADPGPAVMAFASRTRCSGCGSTPSRCSLPKAKQILSNFLRLAL